MADLRIRFLLEASSNLDSTSQFKKILKFYYLCTAKNLQDKVGCKFQYFENKDSCSKCSINLFDGTYNLSVESNKISPRETRMVEAFDSGQILPRSRKVRAKFLKKKMFSYLVFICKFCNNKTKIALAKLDKFSTSEKNIGTKVSKTGSDLLNKKKGHNKIKDHHKNLGSVDNNKQKQTSKKISKQSLPKVTQNEQRKTGAAKYNTTINRKKKENKHTKNNVQTISKTQQKNTILQLAQLLKRNSNSSKSDQYNDKLKNLLR